MTKEAASNKMAYLDDKKYTFVSRWYIKSHKANRLPKKGQTWVSCDILQGSFLSFRLHCFFLTNTLLSSRAEFFLHSRSVRYLTKLIGVHHHNIRLKHRIDHFVAVCSVTWPPDGSKAEDDLVLIQTSLLLCKSSGSYAKQLEFDEKVERSVEKQGHHHQPRLHSKAR